MHHRWRAGDPAGPVFKVTAGVVAVSKTLPKGERQILRFAVPGDICGYLTDDGSYSFDGEAITQEVVTCGFAREGFDAFVARHPTAGKAVQRELSARLVEVGLHLTTVGKLRAGARVADFLCGMHHAFEVRGLPTMSLNLPMTRADIADYLGMNIETVSRALTALSGRRLIEPHNETVVVLDLAGLQSAAGRV